MKLKGRLWKDGKMWLIEVPMLDALTQGRTKKEAFEMMGDLVETMADKPGFKVIICQGKGREFELDSNHTASLISLILRRQRQKSGLSLSDIAARLGVSSRNAYARYEQGHSVPSVEKLDALMKAVSPDRDLVLGQSVAEPEAPYE